MARSLKRRPAEWTEIAGRKETGDLVEFLMVPATALQHDFAVERAMAVARQLQESEELRREYGLEEFPLSEIVEEADVALGMSTTLIAVELAMIVVRDWRGYVELPPAEEGEEPEPVPVPFNRRNVALALQDWDGPQKVASKFLDKALAPVYLATSEGKS